MACLSFPVKAILACLGVVLTFGGLYLEFKGFPDLIKDKIKEQLLLSEGTETFEAWKEPPLPVYFKIHFFNVTNPTEIVWHGEKPILNEVGPYVYREIMKKVDIKYVDAEKTYVSYKQVRSYVFEPEMSGDLRESDLITTLNTPMVGINVLMETGTLPLPIQIFLQHVLNKFNNTDAFVTKPVDLITFKGYNDPVLDYIYKVASKALPLAEIISLLLNIFGIEVPLGNITLPEDFKFGLLIGKNNSDDGTYVVHTGRGDSTMFTNLISWKNQTQLPWWNSDYCNMMNGTDGGQYPPFLSKKQRIYIFASDLCRSLYVEFEKEVNVLGIPGYRFIPPPSVFADVQSNPDNLCYCTPDEGHCLLSGVLNGSVCQQGAPIIYSSPHFYQGDQSYVDAVVGLNPNKSIHETALDLHPVTGIPLSVVKRIQINIKIKNFDALPSFRNIPDIIMPVLWVSESASLDGPTSEKLKSQVLRPMVVLNSVSWAICGVGVVLVLASVIIICNKKK